MEKAVILFKYLKHNDHEKFRQYLQSLQSLQSLQNPLYEEVDLNYLVKKDETLFTQCILDEKYEFMKTMIEYGIDIDFYDPDLEVRYQTHYPIHTAVINSDLKALKILIEAGADLEVKNEDGHTVLMEVVYNDCYDTVDNDGYDTIKYDDSEKIKQLYMCDSYVLSSDKMNLMKTLLDASADPNFIGNDGSVLYTLVLHHWERGKYIFIDCFLMLLEYADNLEECTTDPSYPSIVNILSQLGDNNMCLNIYNKYYNSRKRPYSEYTHKYLTKTKKQRICLLFTIWSTAGTIEGTEGTELYSIPLELIYEIANEIKL